MYIFNVVIIHLLYYIIIFIKVFTEMILQTLNIHSEKKLLTYCVLSFFDALLKE